MKTQYLCSPEGITKATRGSPRIVRRSVFPCRGSREVAVWSASYN